MNLKTAYEKGRRSGQSQVDTDVALERFCRKYQPTREQERAWWNGFEDVPNGRHAPTCPLGLAGLHQDCEDR